MNLWFLSLIKRFKESSNADLSSLKYIQKLIDLRISHLQKTKSSEYFKLRQFMVCSFNRHVNN